ncbi:hypothetical protein [Prosthecochloris sp.]|uniref:hypothetical protein n=1 Tax=Prosthecochloris sp. TaxID=290513 RepID=UPI0025EA12A3|nr:hypothetical protein [Prosthecochloris sp.]
MSLTCGWPTGDYDSWFFEPAEEYSFMPYRTRRTRCCSCGSMLNSGDIVTEHICYRNARTAFEERIWGDQVFLANKYLCESCSDIYFSLVELGYGFNLGDDMRDLLRDFQDIENARKVET